MKNLFTASILAISVTIFSCSNNSSEEYKRAPAPGETPQATAPATGDASNPFAPAPVNIDPAAYEQNTTPQQQTQTPATQRPVAQTTGNVEHFICPKGHAGGGGETAGNCTVCGAELEHNAAYHQQPAQTNPSAIQPEITPANTPANTPPQTEPAQNASGVFHYICPQGHPGGSGTMENCATCGAQLVHNDKYHQ